MVDAGGESVRVATDVAWTVAGDRVVALAVDSVHAQPVSLEGTAAVVWRAIAEDGKETFGELLSTMVDAYDAPASIIEGDLKAVVADLRSMRLLAV